MSKKTWIIIGVVVAIIIIIIVIVYFYNKNKSKNIVQNNNINSEFENIAVQTDLAEPEIKKDEPIFVME